MDEEAVEIRRKTQEVMRGFCKERGSLIPALQKTQDRLEYLPEEALAEIADHLDIPLVDVYGVATFYNQFRFNKPGRHSVRVCMGTACHVNGAGCVLDAWKRELDIDEGQTTLDGAFDLERVACVGCCVRAPVVVVDDRIYGKFRVEEVSETITSIMESESDR